MVFREGFRRYLFRGFRSAWPYFQLAAAALFAVRAAVGLAFSVGHPASAGVAVAFSLVFGFSGGRCLLSRVAHTPALPGAQPKPLAYFTPALPFLAAAVLSTLDAALSSSAPFLSWPFILVASAFFSPLLEAYLLSFAVVLLSGTASALVFLDGGEASRTLLSLAMAAPVSLIVATANRAERKRSFKEAAERIEREHALSTVRDAEVEIAARIQRSLLLERPSTSCRGVRLEALTVASSAVDGDFYGFVPYSSDSIDVLIGDVMGKGVPAALLGAALKSAFLHSSLHLLVKKRGTIPRLDELVSSVHDAVVDELSNLESFATLQYARVDAGRSRMDFVDCGHTPILHYDAVMNVTWVVKGTDLPLGFSDRNRYTRYAIPLAEGDRLLFYSDGVTEAPSESGELFGETRLAAILKANASLAPEELVRRVMNTAMFFTSSIGFRDDVTCIAISLDSSSVGAKRSRWSFPWELNSLASIRTYLDRNLSGLDGDLVSRILLAVNEAATNVILHGATTSCESSDDEDCCETLSSDDEAADELREEASYDGQTLNVELIRAHSWLSVRIVYRGIPFAWHVPADAPDIDALPEGGFGRALMDKSADSVLYANGPEDLRLLCLVFETAS
jgi:sigma-B regulation protein RsbU (phosphoserine phosphatase)